MLFRFKALKPAVILGTFLHPQIRCYSTQKAFKPLRVLFCGADEFSIYSLSKLHALQNSRPDRIANIDVVCRPDKPVGRNRKQFREVPIKNTAQSLGLQLHQIDTFTNWTPPPTDLVVTVSFGLLVPARILNGAKYGGINVHPSLLPDFRGPAPIQHALLQGRKQTGVSLQTMHPTQFDKGDVLAQQIANVPGDATMESMTRVLGDIGAEMLASGIENGLFVEPQGIDIPSVDAVKHAPKITPQDRKIGDWTTVTAEEIIRRDRVLGKLWDDQLYGFCFSTGEQKRVTFLDGWKQFSVEEVQIEHRIPWDTEGSGGVAIFRVPGVKGLHFAVEMREGGVLLAPNAATIEGEKKGMGLRVLTKVVKARIWEA